MEKDGNTAKVCVGGRVWRRVGRVAALAGFAFVFGAAQAQEVKSQAMNAAVADGVSTAAGLALGAVEMNPLGPLLAVGMKVAMFHIAEGMPDTERPAAYATAASVWSGAAANNICIAAAILTGGSFVPACLAVGVAWGVKTWKDSEHEREFWEGCALLRAYAQEPELTCVYTPPEMHVASAAGETVAASPEMIAP